MERHIQRLRLSILQMVKILKRHIQHLRLSILQAVKILESHIQCISIELTLMSYHGKILILKVKQQFVYIFN